MSPAAAFLAEFEHEIAITRRMLERVPAQHLDYRPHAKSADLGYLAMHIANQPSWGTAIMQETELDLATFRGPARPTSTAALLDELDRCAAAYRDALQSATPGSFAESWTLRMGSHVIVTLPRAAILRSLVMNHLIHHRGQLSVYLRLLDVPVPGTYGPSADEPFRP